MTETDLELPRRLRHAFAGRFEDVVVLGSGPHGSLLRARDAVYGEVAVKILTSHAADVAEAGALAVQRASDALDHPRVVHVLEVLRDGGLVAIVTPHLTGGSLESRMASREPMSWDAIRSLITSVAEILDHAHGEHIVHGGVRPCNVVFDAGGRAFLRDFGITQTFAGMTRDTSAEAYAAPEWWRGNHLSPRSDQYSLAVIALELITGRRRTDVPSVEGIQVLEPIEIPGTAELRPGLGLGANRALAQALAASPNNRFETTGAFAAALGVAALRSHTATERRRKLSWHGTQWIAVGTAAAVAALVAVDASRRHDARRGLGAIERGTRGLAEQIDVAGGATGPAVRVPGVPEAPASGAADAASRAVGARRVPLPDIPDAPSLRVGVPNVADAGAGAATAVTGAAAAAGSSARRTLDSLSRAPAQAVQGSSVSGSVAGTGTGVARAGRAITGALDSARARATAGVANAAEALRIGRTPRSTADAPTSSDRGTTGGLPAGGGTTGGRTTGGMSGGTSTGGTTGGATSPRTSTSVGGETRAGGARSGGTPAVGAPATGAAAAGATANATATAGFISVTSDQPRMVLVDGVPRGQTPLVVSVAAGRRRVSASGLPVQTVVVTAGETVSVRLAVPRP